LDTKLKARFLWLMGFACVAMARGAYAAPPEAASTDVPQRKAETTVGFGYAGVAALKMPVGYDAAKTPLSSASFWEYSLQITRRFEPQFELGLITALDQESSNGKGAYAHALSRFMGEIRLLPFGFSRVEPWIGAQAGFVIADDQATWDATTNSGAHAVSTTRLGHLEGVSLGARLRLSDWIAIEATGGLQLIGFPKASVEHEAGDTTGTYLIHPTDYRTRLWSSAMISAEITVMD
jgi:hypothetical protein